MDANLQQTISMYHTGFLICLALAVCFLIVSVILFIVFNIPKIITNRTGRAMRKSMKAIEEKNARTGQLRQNISSSLGRRSRRLSQPDYPAAFCAKAGGSAAGDTGVKGCITAAWRDGTGRYGRFGAGDGYPGWRGNSRAE